MASQISEATQAGRLRIIPPAGYLDFIALQASALLVLTDSGGVQEETTALGVPCLTLRENTERPITLTHGTNQLVGTDPGQIVAAAKLALASPAVPRRPALWDGHAGERIAAVLLDGGADQPRRAGVVPQARPGDIAGSRTS
jgi:UDP-N-acetylglucosamine 2-epimerase (non-hydrolysing)